MKHISGFAFYDCISLQTIRIPDSVEYLGERTFDGCSGLTSATIGKNFKRWEDISLIIVKT